MPNEPTLLELSWRLQAVEKREEQLELRLEQIRGEINTGFLSMKTDMKELRLVTKDLYDSEQKAQDDKIEAAAKLAWWGLALMIATTLAALLGLAIRLASA